jgi:hypothetical protein
MAKKSKKIKKGQGRTARNVVNLTITSTAQECKIVPGKADIYRRNGDQLKWKAANTDATIWFPTGEPFGWFKKSVASGSSVLSGVPNTTGDFEYVVYCDACKCFAVANSNPQVIVH